jgi:hypothetical protein
MEEEYEDPYQDTTGADGMKTHRKLMFGFGKILKYSFWAASAVLAYHLFLVKKFKVPEEYPTEEHFLSTARFIDWSIYDLK